jgi:hypothetical protein
MSAHPIERFALLGNHLPRQCGIATFTTDLVDALVGAAPAIDTLVVAMNDAGHRHAYPARVRFEIPEPDAGAYRRAEADFGHARSRWWHALHLQSGSRHSQRHEPRRRRGALR